MFKKVPLILISIVLVFFLFNPEIVFAQEQKAYWPLEGKEVENLLDIIRKKPLTKANFDLYFESLSGYDPNSPRKTGAVVLVKQAVLKEQLDYWFKEVPKQLSIEFLKTALKLVRIVYAQDIGTVIEIIEQVSVEEATEYAVNWFVQNDIKIGAGEANYIFDSYKGNPQKLNIQYVIVYYPLSKTQGRIAVEFYSKNPIEPPEGKGGLDDIDWTESTCWPRDRWIENERKRDNDGKLEPFIVRIKGFVKRDELGVFSWDEIKEPPIVEVDFDHPVPEIEVPTEFLEKPSILIKAKRIIEIIEKELARIQEKFATPESPGGRIKEGWERSRDFIKGIGEGFKETTWNLIEALKWYLTGVKPEAQITGLEDDIGRFDLEKLTEEVLSLGEIEEAPEEKIVLEEIPGEKTKLSLEELIERFDEISERAEILLAQAQELLSEKGPAQIREDGVVEEEFKEEEEEKEKIEEELEEEPEEEFEEPLEDKIVFCSISGSQYPARNRIIFNEIAWMGTTNSANDEWIEMKNILGSLVDLSGWQILDKDSQVKIVFENFTLPSGGFLLLERTNDTTVPNIPADLIYTGALSNTGEALYLFDENCNLQDKAEANPYWPAGSNSSKKTMERKTDLGWQTSRYAGGTPKRENSSGEIQTGGGGSTASSPTPPPAPSSLPKLLISEIQIESEKGTSDEFIELYNPNNEDVFLKWWSIQRATAGGSISKKNFETAHKIPAKGYFLIVNKYASQALLSLADMAHNSFSITSGDTIFLVKNKEEIVSGGEQTISDKVGYGEAFSPEGVSAPTPSTDQTLGRKWLEVTNEYQDTDNNQEDFEIQTPTPKAWNQSLPKDTPLPKILISEIQTEGPTSTKDEFIELYNPNSFAVDLSNFSLKKKTSSGSESNLVSSANFSGTITSLDYFLIVPQDKENGDLNYSGKDYYIAKDNTVLLYSKYNNLIDKVGFGQAQDFETAPAQNHPRNYSLGRKWLATNEYQNTDNNSEDFEIQIPTPQAQNESDPTPPETTITSGPSLLTNQIQATFTFSSNEEGSTFQCKLDSGTWKSCSSPTSYSGLATSSHTFYVKAIDPAGNEDQSPAQHSWTIDTTIESSSLSLADTDTNSFLYTNSQTVKVEISDDEEAVAWFLAENSEKPESDNPNWLLTKPSDFTLSVSDPSASSGQVKTVYLWTKDGANNVSQLGNSASIILDTIPPQTFIEQKPDNPTSQTQAIFTFTVNEENSTFECKIDETDWQNCQSPKTFDGLAEGENTFSVRAKDLALNLEINPPQYSWTIEIPPPLPPPDTTAPSAISPLSAQTGPEPGKIILSWTAPGDDENIGQATAYFIKYFSEEITEENWASSTLIAEPPLPQEAGTEQSFTVSGLADNTIYYFAIKSKDEANNTSTISNSTSSETLSAILEVSTTSLNFTAIQGGVNPQSQFLTIENKGKVEMNWSISTTSDWILATPGSGTLAGNTSTSIEISIDVSGLLTGNYQVTSTVEAVNTKNSPQNVQINLTIEEPLNQAPIASFSYWPENPRVGQNVTFDASDSYDPEDDPLYFLWNFGDGILTTTISEITTHSFATSGEFLISLRVQDSEGATSSTSTSVQVLEKPKILISEVQIRDKEFVELYNFGEEPASTTGWYLSYFSVDKNWNEPQRNWEFSATTTIPSQSFYLVGIKDYPEENGNPNADWQVLTQAGAPYKIPQLSNEKGAIGIFSCDPSAGTVEAAKNCKIDAFAWKKESATSTLVFEGNPFSFQESEIEEKSFQRRKENENYIDTNDNSTDFEILSPTPTNSKDETKTALAPDPVENFQVASSTDNTVILTWSTTTDEDTPDEKISYTIYYSRVEEIISSTLAATTTFSTTTQTTTITLSNLYYDSTYYFGIRAFDGLHYSALTTTTPYSIPLPKITDLNAGPSAIRKAIDLFWTSSAIRWYDLSERKVVSATPTSYEIKYAEKEIVESEANENQVNWENAVLVENSLIPKSEGEIEHFLLENLTPSKIYYFAVKSIGENGTVSEISNSPKAKAIPGFYDNGNGTITDLYTGLMWVKDGQSTSSFTGATITQDNAITFANNLIFADYDDWRLPNFKELASIVHYNKDAPTVDENFSGINPDKYWSSTKRKFGGGFPDPIRYKASYINLSNGKIETAVYDGADSPLYYFLPTRGPEIPAGSPEDKFDLIDNGDGTVTAQRTNLIWAKAEFAQVGNKKKTWEEAIRFANNRVLCQDGSFQGDKSELGDCSEYGGIKYSDFRLPNIQEILEVTKIAPSLILPWGGTYRYYWSSTSAGGNNYWSAGNEYDWGETSITPLFSTGGDPSVLNVQIIRDDF